jgi:hypothetical protein
MRVYIGPYINRWISEIHSNYMNRKYPTGMWPGYAEERDAPIDERAIEAIEDVLQWSYNQTINRYLDSKKRKIKVKIDSSDTWSMDHTLAHIIVPMLKQLKETKHGSPWTDDEDVPEELRSTNAPPKNDDWDLDENHHKRWDWVIDEMIWAFEQKMRDDWEGDYYKYDHVEPNKNSTDFSESLGIKLVWEDPEGRKAHQQRMSNGFRLFGKYLENLWN